MKESKATRWIEHLWHLYSIRRIRIPEEQLLHSVLHAGDTAIDIGANIGTFTTVMSKAVGPTGRVMAFEPIPHTFRTLHSVVRMYGLHNVSARNCAVSNRVGRSRMRLSYWPSGRVNYYQCALTTDEGGTQVEVETISIDHLNLSRLDFAKIDVEGHELEVLSGSEHTLRRHHPALLVEVTNPDTPNYLTSLGYKYRCGGDDNQLFTI